MRGKDYFHLLLIHKASKQSVFRHMILPSFIIIDINKYRDLPDVDMPESAYIAYKITSTSIFVIDTFYKELFLSPKKYNFCLLIDLENELDKSSTEFNSTLDFLVSFTFHSNYIRTAYDNPLVLFELNEANTHKYITVVKEAFKGHGYNDIKPMVIGKGDISLLQHSNKNIRFDLQKDFDSLPSYYISAIKKITSSDFCFSFFLECPEELPTFLKIIEQTELMIRRDLPQLFSLLSENRSLTLNESKLISRLELIQEQLNSLNNYHSNYNSAIVGYRKQNTEILKFYKNEYEILPTWYKRLGHIIKVLMGKRTFRSLFNDNVTKYKD
jgi:hypothetical protein